MRKVPLLPHSLPCLSIDISYALSICFCLRNTLKLPLTILIGILIAHFAVNYEYKKPRSRGVSTVPPTTPPPTESPTTVRSTTETFVTKELKRPFVVMACGIRPNDRDELRVKSLVKAMAGLSNSENDCVGSISVEPSCTHTDRLVALVDLKVLSVSSLRKECSKVCEVPGQKGYYLHFDALFDDFTQIYFMKRNSTLD